MYREASKTGAELLPDSWEYPVPPPLQLLQIMLCAARVRMLPVWKSHCWKALNQSSLPQCLLASIINHTPLKEKLQPSWCSVPQCPQQVETPHGLRFAEPPCSNLTRYKMQVAFTSAGLEFNLNPQNRLMGDLIEKQAPVLP